MASDRDLVGRAPRCAAAAGLELQEAATGQMRVEPVTAGAVAQHHGPVNTSVGSIMDLSPLGRVDNPTGGAELVAFRVSHNNVLSG